MVSQRGKCEIRENSLGEYLWFPPVGTQLIRLVQRCGVHERFQRLFFFLSFPPLPPWFEQERMASGNRRGIASSVPLVWPNSSWATRTEKSLLHVRQKIIDWELSLVVRLWKSVYLFKYTLRDFVYRTSISFFLFIISFQIWRRWCSPFSFFNETNHHK